MSKYTILSYLFLVIWSYLGLRTLLNDPRNRINVLFSLLCLSMILYTLFIGTGYSLNNRNYFFMLVKLGYIGMFFFYPVNLHFYLALSKATIRTWTVVLMYLPAVIFNLFSLAGHTFFSGFVKYKGEWIGVFNFHSFHIYMYSFFILTYFVISFAIILKWGRATKINKDKIYSFFILVSLVLIYIGGLVLTILMPYFGDYDYQAFGTVLFSLYIIGMFFLISKFKFMNVNFSLMAHEILSNINDMVVMFDLDMKIIDVNNKFLEHFSMAREDIKNKKFSDIIVDNEIIKNNIRDLRANRAGGFKLRLNYKNGDDYVLTDSYMSNIRDRFGDITGMFVISSEVKCIQHFQRTYKITNREFEIIEHIVSGLTYEETGSRLNIAKRTVDTHLTNIYNKTGVDNKIGLAKIVSEFNIKSCL